MKIIKPIKIDDKNYLYKSKNGKKVRYIYSNQTFSEIVLQKQTNKIVEEE